MTLSASERKGQEVGERMREKALLALTSPNGSLQMEMEYSRFNEIQIIIWYLSILHPKRKVRGHGNVRAEEVG